MQIKAVMTTEIDLVSPETSVRAVAQKMRDDDVGGRVVGMVTDRDIVLRAVAEDGDMDSYTARQVMSPDVLYCISPLGTAKYEGEPSAATPGGKS
jgi:CBS domain-containing protein